MKPFNLNDFKAGKKVVTRDGREVKQLTVFDIPKDFPIYGVVDNGVCSWTVRGTLHNYGDTGLDLFHPDEEMYVNVYKDESITYIPCIHNALCKAIASVCEDHFIGTYKLVKVD